MDPMMFIEQTTAGVPAPIWFIQFFKVLGFTLHMVPMNLWYAGLLVALFLHVRGNENARHFGGRLMRQMPVIVAIGVNLGIVPLLFIQTAYYQVFYPATILMAWTWLAIIALLIPAYYGVYLYAWGCKNGEKLAWWQAAAGWCAAGMFIVIGFIFVNGFSLMGHVDRWGELWSNSSVGGAALGTALNIGDATLWPRWLLMFGLALQTTAVWLLVDVEWLDSSSANDDYRRWAWGFAKKLYMFGLVWFAAAGSWYVFGTWSADLYESMFQWPVLAVTVATALAPGLPWLLMMVGGRRRAVVVFIALAQFGVLGVNAVSRQVVQNFELAPFWDVYSMPEDVQWGPLIMFLVVFVVGLGVIGWMIAQIKNCKPA